MSNAKKFSADELRNFYFSKATNYNSFQKSDSAPRDRATTPSDITMSINNTNDASTIHRNSGGGAGGGKSLPSPVATPATKHDHTQASPVAATPPVPLQAATTTTMPAKVSSSAAGRSSSTAAGSAVAVAKANTSTNVAANNNTGYSAESVSQEYITFLRQQQELVKAHCGIDELFQQFLDTTHDQRNNHVENVASADELLSSAEGSTDWNWKSKFNAESLAKDAGLSVPRNELKYTQDIPNVVDMQHQQQQLVKLKQTYCNDKNPQENSKEFKVTLENGIRRFDRLIKEFSTSQVDATPVVRLSDNILVQLDNVLAQPPLPHVLQDINDTIAVISAKQKECMDIRDQAHEDGEMNVAERESFRLADLSEELANAQIEKIRILSRAQEENTVGSAVREAYSGQAAEETKALESETNDLKSRCEADLARLYQLKKQVDEAEEVMCGTTEKERKESDETLERIGERQKEAWEQVELLVKQIRQLETDRHNEVKRRVEGKVKDEARRNEYNAFCNIANEQAANYDRTIKNCDTNIHCTKLMAEFLNSGFFTVQKHLDTRKTEIDSTLLEAQKCHLEIFRSVLFTLGDLQYKKERRIEEVGSNIQAAHIQQELCNDSLNPNAKKFSDAKKELLRLRDELELELRDIRDRQATSLEQYKPTEEALCKANVSHSHPMDDLEERRLNTRAKMVEYKAMSLGHVSSAPIKEELNVLRKSLNESRRIIASSSSRSASRSGNVTNPL